MKFLERIYAIIRVDVRDITDAPTMIKPFIVLLSLFIAIDTVIVTRRDASNINRLIALGRENI